MAISDWITLSFHGYGHRRPVAKELGAASTIDRRHSFQLRALECQPWRKRARALSQWRLRIRFGPLARRAEVASTRSPSESEHRQRRLSLRPIRSGFRKLLGSDEQSKAEPARKCVLQRRKRLV